MRKKILKIRMCVNDLVILLGALDGRYTPLYMLGLEQEPWYARRRRPG